jgi:2-polyprenyl-3-methyl-5-hydroxy-6-metoxy-1,4-benzoquinol methylase
MYDFIVDVYNLGAGYEQLKEVPGTSDYPRAKITKEIFQDFLSKKQNDKARALEIGPGSGFITEHLCSILPADGSCTLDLMDFSQGFLDNTKEKKYNVHNYICFDVTKYQNTPQIENEYDIIFFQEVLEHLVSPFTALVNIHSMLKEGGLLFLTIPNSGWWRNIYTENLRTKLLLRPKIYLDTHISEISVTGLIKLATMTGFDIERIEYYCSRVPLFKSISSEQVGFVLVKRDTPAARWKELGAKNQQQYFSYLEMLKTGKIKANK